MRAAGDAQAAIGAGVDGIMVFAPFSWALGADPRAIVNHHRGIAEAVAAPIYMFQGSAGSFRLAYTPDVLRGLLEISEVVPPRVIADCARHDPQIQIPLETRPLDTVLQVVENGLADVALVIPAYDRQSRDFDLVAVLRAVCICPEDHSLPCRRGLADGFDRKLNAKAPL